MINHQIKPGVSATFTREARMSSTLYPSGESGAILDYLVSTATIVEVVMEASSKLLDPLLPDEYITVGKDIELSHDNAALLGEPLTYDLNVRAVEDDIITVEINISDPIGLVCKGIYKRVIVNKEELINKAFKRAAQKI